MTRDDDIALRSTDDNIAVLYPSQYLKKEDLRGRDVRLTISRVTFRNVRMTNNTRERKVVIHFHEMQKRPEEERKVWIVGKTCAQLIAEIHGPNPHTWVGKQIVIYADQGVMFGRQRVGGIRVRVATPPPYAAPPPDLAEPTAEDGVGTIPDEHPGLAVDDPLLIATIRQFGLSDAQVAAYMLRVDGDQARAARLIAKEAKVKPVARKDADPNPDKLPI